jgi:outer membrane biosynthesis protein TonB
MRAAWALLMAASTASAQPSPAPADPVVANFRAYRAALERNDLPAAETAAAAALAASQAAQGARTAVLALNLANLRLELGDDYDALAPARTAHALATGTADAGVDPVAAALTLGRAELAAGDAAGAPRLLAAFTAAESNADLDTDVYNAAVALGSATIDAKNYDSARRAWATAARLAHATDDPTFSRAIALTGEGAAIFLASADRALLPSGGRAALTPADAQAANDAFATAQRLLMPAALAAAPDATLTPPQRAYAQALVWQSALLAKVQSIKGELPAPPTFGSDMPAFDDGALCRMRTIRNGAEVEYPPEALDRYGVGAVVVHFGLDSIGAVTSRTIAAAIPLGVLADAVEEVADEWRVEPDPSSRFGCRIPPSTYVNVRFVLE